MITKSDRKIPGGNIDHKKKVRINDPQRIIDLIFKRILDKFRFSVETEIEDDIKPGYIYVKPAIVISESFNLVFQLNFY
ncbi:MAG: hypothetical protein K8R79_10465 [Calditrichales bacterium]|nr:hypothetical protein [Calditrichales bacterium]